MSNELIDRNFAIELATSLDGVGDEEWSVGWLGRDGSGTFKKATLVQKPGYFSLEDGLRSRDEIHE